MANISKKYLECQLYQLDHFLFYTPCSTNPIRRQKSTKELPHILKFICLCHSALFFCPKPINTT